jgi:hypothetical protein
VAERSHPGPAKEIMRARVTWVPWIFPAGALLLLLDGWRRLRELEITTTQVVGHRVAGVFMVLGSPLGLSDGHWPLPAATLVPGNGSGSAR